MNATLTDKETSVHKAIVDLFEVHNNATVTTKMVAEHLGLYPVDVVMTMVALMGMDIIEVSKGVVTRYDHVGYYPLVNATTMAIINSRQNREV